MIVVTGAAGFIGSCLLAELNRRGTNDILAVDELGSTERWKNLLGKKFTIYLDKQEFIERVCSNSLPYKLSAIVHLGACSSTTERDLNYLMRNNYQYSVSLGEYARKNKIRYVYASSAATYGDGSLGYSDESPLEDLRPLNGYGFSKLLTDQYMQNINFDYSAAGVRFFNVYGPNEYHKGEMRSVVHKSYQQIKACGEVQLFKSYRKDFADGEQKRDFIYVKDCCQALLWLLENPQAKGIFNLGTGTARSWNDLVKAVFSAIGREARIRYIDMPENLRDQYQYFTEAKMHKLRSAGYSAEFTSLEDGISDYVKSYLHRSGQPFV
ncbi:MAG: ADP-glyceromanno-heptose 6-epimerase [Proteobacteria bacterium]|nr:MAG: ADP-glyceromanno-heptose 6-epimerase [Pseudomonadota bacterium]